MGKSNFISSQPFENQLGEKFSLFLVLVDNFKPFEYLLKSELTFGLFIQFVKNVKNILLFREWNKSVDKKCPGSLLKF
jgi:hypothetical protein